MKLFFTSLLLMGLGVGAQAGVVTTLADDATAGTLRSEIASAQPGDTITFLAGLHGTISLTASSGTLAISQNLTIQGPGAGVIAVDGGSACRVFSITGGAVSLSGLTIQHGSDQTDSGGGGGILDTSTAALTLTNCTLTGNRAAGYGGGIYNNNGYYLSMLTVTGCTFSGNTASRGGGLYNYGPLTATGCTLNGNTSVGTLDDSINNGSGGGIFNDSGTVTLTGCALTGNSAYNGGGGLYARYGDTTLSNCTFTGNSAKGTAGTIIGVGGGVCNFSGSSGGMAFTNCTLNGNSSYEGGGVYSYGALTLTGCTLAANSVTNLVGGPGGQGGGIYEDGNGPLTLTGCTLAGNSATATGGGVYNFGSGTLTNDILYGNSGNSVSPTPVLNNQIDGPFIYMEPFTYCDIQGSAGTPASPDAKHNFSADPLFVRNPSGTDYGDLHLQGSSPVVGKGIAVSGDTTDHDGVPYASPPSLGAFEQQSAPPARDVTAQVRERAGQLRRQAKTDDYTLSVTLTNTSSAAISGPLSLVLDGLTPDILLASQTGTTAAGYPYQNAPLVGASLAPGQSVTLVLSLDNDTKPGEAIKCTPRVLAGAGAR